MNSSARHRRGIRASTWLALLLVNAAPCQPSLVHYAPGLRTVAEESSGDDHLISQNQEERLARTIAWLSRLSSHGS